MDKAFRHAFAADLNAVLAKLAENKTAEQGQPIGSSDEAQLLEHSVSG